MSHVVIGKGRIQNTPFDIKALKAACEQLGLVFCEGQSDYQWFGRWLNDYGKQDAAYKSGIPPELYGRGAKHVIRLPWSMHDEERYVQDPSKRPYEIGVVEMSDGQLGLVFDNWSGGSGVRELVAKVGDGCSKLMQTVNQQKVVQQVLAKPDHFVKRTETLPNGSIKVVIGKKHRDTF